MLLHFYKMTGAGNDFVMVDNRDLSLSSVLDKETIEARTPVLKREHSVTFSHTPLLPVLKKGGERIHPPSSRFH